VLQAIRETGHMSCVARCCVLPFGREFLENRPLKEQRAKRKAVLVKDMKASGGLDIYPLILNLGPRLTLKSLN